MTFAVLTTVQVREGSIDELAALFSSTNRQLVAEHEDWLGAWFNANRSTNEVTVIARWRAAESYERLRSSPDFQEAMGRFAESFVGPPKVSVNEVIVEM